MAVSCVDSDWGALLRWPQESSFVTKGSKKRARKQAARPARPGGPARPGTRPGRQKRTIGQFRNLGFVAALAAAVIAAIALIGVANLLRGDDNNTSSNTPIDIPEHTAPADGTTLGNADAPVTIYEYSDFQCPYCRVAAAEIVPRLDTEYLATGKAKLIFKIMAFIGQESRWAAEAALCAGEQGKFWEYHNKLYEEQNGENKGTFVVENLKRFAQEIGLNEGDFNTCLDAEKYAAQIADGMDEATNRGVNSTPTFFVGQTQVDTNFDAIAKAIEAVLNPPTPTVSPTAEGTAPPEGTPGG
jgi:protein-disulfide isomerase